MCEFRRLTVDHLEMVLEMNRNFREGFIEEDSAQRFLKDPQNWIFAAIHEDSVIGFAYGYELNRLDRKQNMLYIHEVGVMEAYQRKGVGYKMMCELLQECKRQNICKCFLTTYQNNVGANALYRKLGGLVPEESQGNDTVYYFPID